MAVLELEAGLMIASLIIFIGFIGSVLLNRHNIPDAIFLILLGYLLGPATNILDVNILRGAAPYIGAVALISIMFESSFGINLRELIVSAKPSLILAVMGFILSAVGTSAFLYYVVGFYPENWLMSFLVGSIIGGGSGAIIVSVIQRINVPTNIQVTLSLESVLTDVFVIIIAETILYLIRLQSLAPTTPLDIRSIGGNIAASFSISIVAGVIAGAILANLLDKFKKEKHVYTMTIAYLILLYVIAQYLNGSGAITVLTCGIVLTNSKHIPFIFSSRTSESLTYQLYSLESMHSELTLLLKIFFFVEVGIIMNIQDISVITLSVIVSLLLLLIRFPIAYYVANSLHYSSNAGLAASIISVSYARGLAAAVMAVTAFNQFLDIHGGVLPPDIEAAINFILQLTSGVILFTNLFFTLGVVLLRSKIRELMY